MTEPVIIDANVLASWLVKNAPSVLWTVDGDYSLQGQLSLPATGRDLADALRHHGGRLVVMTAMRAANDPAALEPALDDIGGRVFELAWAADPGRRWFVIEDIEQPDAVAASH